MAWCVTAAALAAVPSAVAAPLANVPAGVCPAVRIIRSPLAPRTAAAETIGDASSGAAQSIGVTVPRGPLLVVRVGANRLRVVDGRDTRTGWALRVHAPARVCVTTIEIDGASTRGLHATPRSLTGQSVVTAAPGTGNGAFDVEIALAPDVDARNAQRILASMRFDITPNDRRVSSAAAG